MLLQRALLLALAQNSPSGMKPLSCFKFAKNILTESLQFYLFIFSCCFWCLPGARQAVTVQSQEAFEEQAGERKWKGTARYSLLANYFMSTLSIARDLR